MDARFIWTSMISLAAVTASGCATPAALRRQTVHQGDTVADIHQQQVLDNLAKFVADPYAIPSFAVAASGSTEVADQGNVGLNLGWISSGFDAVGLSLGASRDQSTSWTTTPVTDPRKLELMRCAYQRAASECTGVPESACCPDCRKRFNEFYTGRGVSTKTVKNKEGKEIVIYECDEHGRLSNLVPEPCEDPQICARCGNDYAGMVECPAPGPVPQDPDTVCYCNNLAAPGEGAVNSECLYPECGCWLQWGCNKCVPKGCGYVGHHCGTYVWVAPGPGRDELAKLTLAILDYAVHDDSQLPSKEVTAFLSANGVPTTQSQASYVVRAVIGSDEKSASLVATDAPSVASVQALEDQVKQLKTQIPKASDAQIAQRATESAQLLREIHTVRQLHSAPPLRPLPQQLTPVPNTNLLYLQQQLNTVR